MTEEQRLEASRLWRAGMRQQEIADRLGISRGTLRRVARLNRDIFPDRTGKLIFPVEPTKPVKPSVGHAVRFPPKAPGFDGVTSADHGPRCCKFPLWGDHERFDLKTSLFCDAPALEDSSWCAFHKKATFGIGTHGERNAVRTLERAA